MPQQHPQAEKAATKPRVLILYYSFTEQTRRVADAMGEAFLQSGCEVEACKIEFIDERYRMESPFKPVMRKLMRWLLPQLLGKTGEIQVPQEVITGDYDLVCIGSPTWWQKPAMPVASFLKSPEADRLLDRRQFAVFVVCRKLWWNNLRCVKKLAKRRGGTYVDGASFCFKGSALRSVLSFISYHENGANLDRFWGFKIYEFGIPEEGLERASDFAVSLGKWLTSLPTLPQPSDRGSPSRA